jgi:hypothetical protein
MVPTPHNDTDQSRIVYLVRLISIWYCKWFMLFMTLDMPDETVLGGSISCLVALMVLDFGRVINLT